MLLKGECCVIDHVIDGIIPVSNDDDLHDIRSPPPSLRANAWRRGNPGMPRLPARIAASLALFATTEVKINAGWYHKPGATKRLLIAILTIVIVCCHLYWLQGNGQRGWHDGTGSGRSAGRRLDKLD